MSRRPILQLFHAVMNHAPNLAHDFFLTVGPVTFTHMWPLFSELLKPKFDPETKGENNETEGDRERCNH